MAEPVLFTQGYVALTTATGGATYTDLAGKKAVSATFSMAELDDAVMGDGVEAKYPGIIAAPIMVTCRQDFTTAASGVDKLTYALFAARKAFRVKIRPVNAAGSSTNPSYEYTKMRLHNVSPIDGSHGALLENKLEFRPQSGCSIIRSTTT